MVKNFYCYKKIISIFILLSFILISQSYIFPQSGSITGHVYDKQSKEILTGANIIVKGTSLGAATDINGKYSIRNIPVGPVTLLISYIGYNPISENITISENRTLEQDFYLEAQAIEGQTVTVTAQAEGQLSAINQQLSSNTIENVVSKARIRELPDVNAAESIGRLPGVSIERSGGEANKVEIRGLNPKYSLITVNGVEVPGTGSTDRSVDLSLISSNMLDGIVLKKVVTPDMDADVLGGTVDLRLREAPSGLKFNASAQGGYNSLQKYYGNYNFNGSISNRFFDDRLGIILNLNTDNYDRSADKLQANWTGVGGSVGVSQLVNQELLLREENVNRKRTGASILLDYVIPNGKATANGFFNQLNWSGLYHINDMWTPLAAYNTNRHFYQLEQTGGFTKIFTSALGIHQDFNWIRYDASVSKSGTYSNTPNDRIWQFDQEAGAFSSNAITPTTPLTMFPTIATVDTTNTLLQNVYVYSTRVMENNSSAQFNVKVPFKLNEQIGGFFKSGAKFKWLNRSNNQNQQGENGLLYGNQGSPNRILALIDNAYPSWGIDSLVRQYAGLPINQFLVNYSRENFLGGDYPIGFVLNQDKMNKITDVLKTTAANNTWLTYSIGSLGKDYSGIEDYQAAYIMGEFHITKYVTLIPGVRWEGEHTVYNGQSYRQNTISNQESAPLDFKLLSTERNNSFWLPMVNLIVQPLDWLQIKLARTQTLAHPDFIQYAPITNVSSDQSTINAVNTQLRTAQSTNYDVSVSVFSNDIGLFAVSSFYKNIKDLIFYANYKLQPGLTPPPELNIPSSWYSQGTPQINTYMNNPNQSKYYGIELEWQTHFWYLPSVLQGLVLNINFTHIYSEMYLQYDSVLTVISGRPPRQSFSYEYVKRDIKTRMPDQPANIANVTIGYDLGGFSARLSYLYQADKLTGIGYSGSYPSTVFSSYTGPYERWDLSVQQKITSNIQLFVNLNNINARPDKNYTGSTLSNPKYFEYYGFTMDLGARLNL
jgi:TonB-dependent receptor